MNTTNPINNTNDTVDTLTAERDALAKICELLEKQRDEARQAFAALRNKMLEFTNDAEWLDGAFHERESIGRWQAANKIEDILAAFKDNTK